MKPSRVASETMPPLIDTSARAGPSRIADSIILMVASSASGNSSAARLRPTAVTRRPTWRPMNVSSSSPRVELRLNGRVAAGGGIGRPYMAANSSSSATKPDGPTATPSRSCDSTPMRIVLRMSTEEAPTSTSNSPASTSQSCAATSHTAKARRSNRITTSWDSPGCRWTLAKPRSSLSGRQTDDSTSRT